MALLSDADRERLRQMLGDIVQPVRLVFFTQTLGCDTCIETRQILNEIVPLSDWISLEEHNFLLDKEPVAAYGIELVPAVAIVGGQDSGIRFYGVPAGYEFMSLVEAILAVGRGDSGLSEESRARLAGVQEPVRIQVFVTPT